MSKHVEVKINGQAFRLRAETGQEYVKELAAYVDKVMERIMRATNTPASDRLAIMAALQITDDFFQFKLKVNAKEEAFNQQVNRLIVATDRLIDE
ncbi:MAG: cell division protein ZapA [Magnetococcales bacterium]|nr:cell division protein ZapA [Magnetococcales bacterium]